MSESEEPQGDVARDDARDDAVDSMLRTAGTRDARSDAIEERQALSEAMANMFGRARRKMKIARYELGDRIGAGGSGAPFPPPAVASVSGSGVVEGAGGVLRRGVSCSRRRVSVPRRLYKPISCEDRSSASSLSEEA